MQRTHPSPHCAHPTQDRGEQSGLEVNTCQACTNTAFTRCFLYSHSRAPMKKKVPPLLSGTPELPTLSPRISAPLSVLIILRLVQWATCPQLCTYSHKWLSLSRVTYLIKSLVSPAIWRDLLNTEDEFAEKSLWGFLTGPEGSLLGIQRMASSKRNLVPRYASPL